MNSSSSLSFFSTEQLYVSGGYFIVTIATGVVLALLGDFHVAYNYVDSIGMIYFLFYTSVVFPTNIIDFSKFFGDYLYSFLPNPISSYISQSDDVSSLPYSFQYHGFTKTYFLYNSSYTFCFIGVILSIYVILKALSYFDYFFILRRKLSDSWESDGVTHILAVSTYQLTAFFFLQLPTLPSFSSSSSNVSYIDQAALIITAIFITVTPALLTYYIYRRRLDYQKHKNDRIYDIKFLSLVRGFKIAIEENSKTIKINTVLPLSTPSFSNEDNPQPAGTTAKNRPAAALQFMNDQDANDLQLVGFAMYSKEEQDKFSVYSKYTHILVMARRPLFVAMLTFLYDYPIFSMIVFIVYAGCLFTVYLVIQPYALPIDNYRNATIEAMFAGLSIIILFFETNLIATSTRETSGSLYFLGWIYIIICICILLIQSTDLFYKLYLAIYPTDWTAERQAAGGSASGAVNEQERMKQEKENAISVGEQHTVAGGDNEQQKNAAEAAAIGEEGAAIGGKEDQKEGRQAGGDNPHHQAQPSRLTHKPLLMEGYDETPLKNEEGVSSPRPPPVRRDVQLRRDDFHHQTSLRVIEAAGGTHANSNRLIVAEQKPRKAIPSVHQQPGSEVRITDKHIVEEANEVVKQRMKKNFFKRNPFITQDDEVLIQQEKALGGAGDKHNESRMTHASESFAYGNGKSMDRKLLKEQ